MPTTAGSTYTPSHSVALCCYKGYFLRYDVTWYYPDGTPGQLTAQLAIKSAAEQTLVIPSGPSFSVGVCNSADTGHRGTENIWVVDRKGNVMDHQTRTFDCRLNLTHS